MKTRHIVLLCFISVASLALALTACRNTIAMLRMDGLMSALLIPDTTIYPDGYTFENYLKVKRGMTQDDVIALLGQPIGMVWTYDGRAALLAGLDRLTFGPDGRVNREPLESTHVKGLHAADVLRTMGTPARIMLWYSSGVKRDMYRIRRVDIERGRVTDVAGGVYFN